MKTKIEAIRARILEGGRPEHSDLLWAGADLVISGEPVPEMYGKVVVVTEHAAELSDLVYALKDACGDWLDYMNKYEFYPSLGKAAADYLEERNDLQGLLLCVTDEALRMEERMNSMLYFAYGSNMDERQMANRCPGAKMLEKMTLRDYRFALDEAGVATIVSERGAEVEGLLWMITPENLKALNRYEGVAYGCYRQEWIGVRSENFCGRALVYISNRPVGPEKVRSGYMECILNAAEIHSFSDGYIRELRNHYDALKGGDFE